jgi:hypothetical protein
MMKADEFLTISQINSRPREKLATSPAGSSYVPHFI